MPEPDCFLCYRISAGTRNFTSSKSDVYLLAAAVTRGFTMDLFTEPVSCRNTFVGGTCAPPSALLVFLFIRFKAAGVVQCHATSTVSTHFLIHSSAHLCHQHSHHPSFLHSFTPGSKPTFSTNSLHVMDCVHDHRTRPDLSCFSIYF